MPPIRWIEFLLFVCFWAQALPPVPDVARMHSLIANGSFEAGAEKPGFWACHPPRNNGRNEHTRDSTQAHSGAVSGKLVYLDTIEGPNKAAVQWMRYGIPVEGGSGVLVAGWVRTEGVHNGHVGIHMYDADGGHLGFRSIPHPPKTEGVWQPFEQTIMLPETARAIGIALYAERGGTTWYDDITVMGTPTVEARRGTPVVDGDLRDEALWGEEEALDTFMQHTGQGLGTAKTRAWIAYDDEALYVAFDCPHRQGADLKLDAHQRDGTTWLDDSVEVFLDADHDHRTYVQFCVNALGVLRDSRGSNPDWDSRATALAKRYSTHWSVELRIPYEDLDLTLRTGATWGINLVRNDRVVGETVTWSLGGFHQPSRFGTVRLDPDLRACLQPALARETARIGGGMAALLAEFTAAGITAAETPAAFAHLADLKRRLALLTSADGALETGDWHDLRDRAAEAAALVGRARAAAVSALYGDTGDAAFAVRIADSMRKVRRDGDVSDAALARKVSMEAAGDESESFQLVLIPGARPLANVTVTAAPLQGPGGSIPLAWHPVGYVETGPPRGYPVEYVGWWPDILFPPGPISLVPGQRQPLWFRVDVPPLTAAGMYRGHVTIAAGDLRVQVPVSLRVRGFSLPRPGALPCAFGLYASALSKYYHGKTPYREVMSLLDYRRWIDFMARYRLTPKNVANEYHGKRHTDAGDVLDLSALEALLREPAGAGFPPYSFGVFRLPCPRDWREGVPKSDPQAVLDRLALRIAEYERLRLPPQAYLYGIDEPAVKAYPFVRDFYERVRRIAPGYPIMQTVNQRIPEELAGLVDIWCPLSSQLDAGMAFYRKRLAAGDALWLYVCCGPKPPYANFFVDQPAIDHRMLFWQAWQAGASGVLYWCVCWWEGLPGPGNGKVSFQNQPVRFTEHLGTYRTFGVNGDGLLIWPGPDMTPWPSLRLEVIRDGIEDYEYLALLQRCIVAAEALPEERRPAAEMLVRAREACAVPSSLSRTFTDFCKDPAVLTARRRAVADSIESLVRILGSEPPPRRN